MKLLDYFRRLNPIEGIPTEAWNDILDGEDYRNGYVTQDFYGGLKVHIPKTDIEYPIVRCINKYYTRDPKGKKLRATDNCFAIINALFENENTANWLQETRNCATCHRQCLALQKEKKLWFVNKKKKTQRSF